MLELKSKQHSRFSPEVEMIALFNAGANIIIYIEILMLPLKLFFQ